MELKKSGILIIDEELKEESAWTETDLARRRALRSALESGEVPLLIIDITTKEPRIFIKSPEGGPNPFFTRAVNLREGQELPDPEGHRGLVGIEGLDQVQDPANRLDMIARQLPSFIESFHYTQRVPVKIYLTHADLHKKEPASTVTPGKSGELPHVEIDQSKLEPFYIRLQKNLHS